MIYEYALDPELVATWGTRENYGKFMADLAPKAQRIASVFPKKWKKLAFGACRTTNEKDKARLEELLKRIWEQNVKRSINTWDEEKSWLENALGEHGRAPFHAILSKENHSQCEHVLTDDDLWNPSCALWDVKRSIAIKRRAPEMAEAVAPMLRMCSKAVFIDPHFDPGKSRYINPLKAFLNQLFQYRSTFPSIESLNLQLKDDAAKRSPEDFHNKLEKAGISSAIPTGTKLIVTWLREKNGGQSLHNRYILTDLGGVTFGHGLDEGDDGQTDDVTLMDADQYQERWNEYAGPNPVFDKVYEVELAGKGYEVQ